MQNTNSTQNENNTRLVQPMNFNQPIMPMNVAAQPVPVARRNDMAAAGPDNVVHLWIQKRTGRKRLTFIQGLPKEVDANSLAQKLRKEFHCNCTEIEHPKLGSCIQLSGDFREDLKQLFVKSGIVRNKRQVKVHGD